MAGSLSKSASSASEKLIAHPYIRNIRRRVASAGRGPKEDTSGSFKNGGWSFNYWDEMSNVINEFMGLPFELLLGKCTYDLFAAFWPHTTQDPAVAKKFNSTKKYVVSHEPMELSWNNSMLITNDVVSEIKKLKEKDGPDLWMHGSGNLIQTLLVDQASELFD